MIREFDIVAPPNQGELERLLKTHSLGSAVLPIVAREHFSDELGAKRNENRDLTDVNFMFHVDTISGGSTPFLIGYLDNSHDVVARIEVQDILEVDDAERPLGLVFFDAE